MMLYTAKGTSAFLVPFANVLKNATGSWEAVFLVAAVMNILVVLLALFVLHPDPRAPPPPARSRPRHRLTRASASATSLLSAGSLTGYSLGHGVRIAAGSIAIGCLVLAMKAAAWWITGSAALYSDALESTVNVAASVIALVALRFAAIPPDANHPYGHDKAEFFAAVIEGVLIVVAALSIFEHAWETWHSLRARLSSPSRGIALNAVATVLNGAWSAVLLRTGRRLRSPALVADGKHLFADVVTSIGIAAVSSSRC